MLDLLECFAPQIPDLYSNFQLLLDLKECSAPESEFDILYQAYSCTKSYHIAVIHHVFWLLSAHPTLQSLEVNFFVWLKLNS